MKVYTRVIKDCVDCPWCSHSQDTEDRYWCVCGKESFELKIDGNAITPPPTCPLPDADAKKTLPPMTVDDVRRMMYGQWTDDHAESFISGYEYARKLMEVKEVFYRIAKVNVRLNTKGCLFCRFESQYNCLLFEKKVPNIEQCCECVEAIGKAKEV